MTSPLNTPQEAFIAAFTHLACEAHANAITKGWWYDRSELINSSSDDDFATMAVDAMNLALIHSEVSECLEALRHGNPPDDKIPEFSGAEAELADVIIRIMDTAAARGWRIAEAVVAKMEMNKGREHKHGKSF